ncbi:MAG TPA: F0F1 ATP synthase subunit A [Saprospiraceae bacterium]|nr:F0F1 ATP synthase subunit A [Saprospiraceae bacterium]HQW56883.1 F0F1 ATP synthase subunit A [Saprospiraceae bacterium]
MIINRLKFLLFTCLFTGFGLIIPAASLLAQEPHPDAASTTMVAEEWKIENMIFEHINNSNEFHIVGHIAIPLPCILYSREDGLTTFMSSALEHGHKAINRYVLVEGVVKRVKSLEFPAGEVAVDGVTTEERNGAELSSVSYQGKSYEMESASTLGQNTSFFDFSISKVVFTMILASIFLIWLFTSVAKAYEKRKGMAPTGKQNLMEVMVNFIIDEVAKPMLGDRYMRFLPFLLTIFFFILTLNLFGLIPFMPFGANVTGNIAVTMTLAVITFILVNINGNGAYWKHIFWMPGIPIAMKLFLAPIELLGIFIKPISLMIRLFANITAGHIIILSLVGLIFVFGKMGASIGGATAGAFIAVPFTLFMNLIELIVALIQAFIFTILAASYLGAATEEVHH